MDLHQILCLASWTFLGGNYLDGSEGHSYGQRVIGSFIMTMCPLTHRVSQRAFCETSHHPGDSAPLKPRFGTLWLLPFPKTKITFEKEEILNHWWDSGKYDRGTDGDWENCVRSQGAYFEGDWGVIVLCTMFLVSCIFFNKCLCFSYCMAGYVLDRPHTSEASFPNPEDNLPATLWETLSLNRPAQLLTDSQP